MRIVVVGGTGFVGRHLIPRLSADGHEVTVLSRNRESQRELLVLPRVSVRSTQLYKPGAIAAACAGADVLINLVGILQAPGRSGAGFQRAHVELTKLLIGAARQARVPRLLAMSSLGAGSGTSHYLRTRGEAEQLVRSSGLKWTLFQPSVIFGPGDGLFFRFARLLPWVPVLPLVRAGTRFQPVWVQDVVAAFANALVDAQSVGQTYELGGPDVVTLKEIVKFTAVTLKLRRLILPMPDLFGHLQGFACDFLPAQLKPFSSDNLASLKLDSVCQSDGLARLGIKPSAFAPIVRGLLGASSLQAEYDRYRKTAH